ncbi:acyl-CoA synthetase [Nocardia sp. NBC_01329]|uniref:acyl-CoA synthetase n=1 Tax=Nocardia sp. NBC_01329 TaxID=2903594 RepID=UPI002E108A16|nr:acyl-CoA synthetase [Nocardia sp. NBC_01329]
MANNFADLFEHSVDAMPERIALIEEGRRVTYRELEEDANRLAHHLAAQGVTRGTHIGFQMHNSIDTMQTLIACFKLAAVPVNINFRYGPDELAYLYDNADLEYLVYHACYGDAVRAAAQRSPRLKYLLCAADDRTPADPGVDCLVEVTAAAPTTRPEVSRTADDLFMMYTGGTTGMPKGVLWRQEDMWRVLGGGIDFYSNEPVADEYQQSRTGAAGEPSTWMILPPLMHLAAMMPTFIALWSGNCAIFVPRFDPAHVWRTIAAERPGVLVVTGDAMARPLIDSYRSDPVDATGLFMIASGAALLTQSTKNALLDLVPNLFVSDSIGSSETGFGGIGFAQRDADPARKPRVSIGRGAVVVDDAGHPVEPGAEGWLAKTGAVPLGYYKDPERTDKLFKVVDGQRIVVTDDRARLEDDGTISLIGRGNMVINTGGEKVFAEEVEGVVKSHSAIYDATVIGVDHERWGQRVAVVVSLTGDGLDPGDLRAHVRTHLAGYKVPRAVWITETIVRSPSGKPDYTWARKYAAERAPDHDAD